MSKLAYQRFMASYILTNEEQLPENRQEIIDYTEDVLQAKGIECDKRIAELSEEQVKEILEEVRRLREKGKKNKRRRESRRQQQEQQGDNATAEKQEEEEEEIAVSSSN
jgi:ribosomal protein L12E/L44/L45/RPP1/RPP2